MNEQKGVFKNLYKNLVTPILKKDSGIDAEYLTNLSLNLLSFSSRKYNWPLVSHILKNLNAVSYTHLTLPTTPYV